MDMVAMCIALTVTYILMLNLVKYAVKKRDQTCYILDYVCHKPSEEQRADTRSCAKVVFRNPNLGLEEYRFLFRTMVNSGLGEETYCPNNIIAGRENSLNLDDAFSEMDDIIFDTLDNLFVRTGTSPSEIDVLVCTVSLFSPAPSLTARIVNKYKFRDDVKTFNLSGMGCSASVVAIDLVQKLFVSYKNAFAIIVSTESMGPNWYCGKDKSMMLPNILFRTGGCSLLLTNNKALKHQAILKLNCTVRTHLGGSDEAYGCCVQMEDDHGYRGVRLSRSLPKCGAKAIAANLRDLVPKVIPLREIVRYTITTYQKKVMKGVCNPEAAAAMPVLNLKTGINHFCVHPGGRAVIDGIGKGFGLDPYDLEPSRMALHRFGNTSSGGLWYVLGYMEAKKRLKKGEKILMIGLGSGFKCNSCVWEVMKDLEDENVWKDSLDRYPPKTLLNPSSEKFEWINGESVNAEKVRDFAHKL